jgi:hypothetical protein
MPKSTASLARAFHGRCLSPLALLVLLSGCGVENYLPHPDPNATPINVGANPRPEVKPAQNPSEKAIVRPIASADVNCPPVDVAENGAAVRVGGADNASVRYQFNIGDRARECDPAGPGQATIKIGVAGEVVIGPAGAPGTYSVPLHVTVTNLADKKPLFSKTYQVQATTDGVQAGQFRIVTEPIQVPLTTLQLADVYSITVGFESSGSAPTKQRRHRKATG